MYTFESASPLNFKPFPKIGRHRRNIIVTEKIDGTNASVHVVALEDPVEPLSDHDHVTIGKMADEGQINIIELAGKEYAVMAGSRNRLLYPGSKTDNFGFAGWVFGHAPQLVHLGPGRHYGEWWGLGIQRRYGTGERRFSLFNVGRWSDGSKAEGVPRRPACCHVVPVLYAGPMVNAAGEDMVSRSLEQLRFGGSHASPGFKPAEGIIVYHTATKTLSKETLDGDEHKGNDTDTPI